MQIYWQNWMRERDTSHRERWRYILRYFLLTSRGYYTIDNIRKDVRRVLLHTLHRVVCLAERELSYMTRQSPGQYSMTITHTWYQLNN